MIDDERVPPGWSSNPSTWRERLPIVGLALVGFAIAAYLAAFQLGLIASVWEPFFGDGSRRILTSGVSRFLPVPDAVLGACGYLADAVTGMIGGESRWRTRPWLVIIFGLAVGPLGAVSVLLVILQPLVFNAYCTLCLASAAVSILMIGPAMDEVLASLQAPAANGRCRSLCVGRVLGYRGDWSGAMRRALTMPVLVASAALGAWVYAAPQIGGLQGQARVIHLVAGPLILALSVIALWPVVRGVARVNVPIGLLLVFTPVLTATTLAWLEAAVGVVIALVALIPPSEAHRFGGGWLSLVHRR